MRTLTGLAIAVITVSFIALGCGPHPPAVPPAAPPQTTADASSSSFPPPPIEINPGGDKKIAWTYNSILVQSSMAESSNRLTDELTWKVEYFTVTDTKGDVHKDVQWASLSSGLTEMAVIQRVGSQFHWTIAGKIPEICSKVDSALPACSYNANTQGNSGIPAYLFDFPDLTMKARWTNPDKTTTEDEVTKISLRGRTCPPYGGL